MGGAASAASSTQSILLPQARFATGDNAAWREPNFDDSGWKLLSTTQYYEAQGFEGYDGYSWYRIHVVIPSALRESSDWRKRLRVYLSAIDDSDESYLNGVLIGKTGRMPSDPGGYEGRWDVVRDYQVDLPNDSIRWDADNVIAVRVYDGGGGGGFYRDTPHLSIPQRADGLQFDQAQASHRLLANGKIQSVLSVRNSYPVAQRGRLEIEVRDQLKNRVLMTRKQSIRLAPQTSQTLRWTLPSGPGIQARLRYLDAGSGHAATAIHQLPYRLTPPDGPKPALHGARLLGSRPGTPLHYRIAATGRAPLRFSAQGLPRGLKLDGKTGVISGITPKEGRYIVKLGVRNALGSAKREWTLVAGAQLALTPPMGWNSWYAHGLAVSDSLVRKAAQVFIDKGLAAKGWSRINIDDGWESEQRAADGQISGNQRFPDMLALGQSLHAQGLGFGIYSSPGATTCGGYLGSLGHEFNDAATYGRWGVDFLKYDLCSYAQTLSKPPTLDEQQQPYRLMNQALRLEPRSIIFSLCQYGEEKVWNWGPSVGGQLWRMTGDIDDSWSSVLQNGFAMAPYTGVVAPGRWNDPDMLMVGTLGLGGAPHPSRLTPDEQYSQVSLWSLMAAPLLISNDMRSLDEFTLGLLTNHDVIAINQDALGKGAQRVLDRDGWQVWVKELEGGSMAVGIFNLGESLRSTQIESSLFARPGQFEAFDAWRQKKLGLKSKNIDVTLPAHGVALLLVK